MRIFKQSLLVAVLFIGLPTQDQRRPASVTSEFQNFTLTLAMPKTRYLELQPIPIVITLKNETVTPLMGHSVLGFGTGYLRLYVDRGDGPHEIPLSLLIKDVIPNAREFKPGEEVKTTERLNLKLNEVFPKPGTYQLHARLNSSYGRESVTSKPIEVEIVQPEGLDAQALEFIRNNDEPAYFFTGLRTIRQPEKLQLLENFVAAYGQSAYGDEASFLLGQVQFAKREYQNARTIFEGLSKRSDYVFAGQASEYLRRIEREEKRKERP